MKYDVPIWNQSTRVTTFARSIIRQQDPRANFLGFDHYFVQVNQLYPSIYNQNSVGI
jgi:hypothetical protein